MNQGYFESLNQPFCKKFFAKISKSSNNWSDNTQEIRFIEDFWSLIKGEVYKDGWEAENLDQLKKRITNEKAFVIRFLADLQC